MEKVEQWLEKEKPEDSSVLFKRLYKQALKEGISDADFCRITALTELKKAVETPGITYKLYGLFLQIVIALFVLFVSMLLIYTTDLPIKRTTVLNLWFNAYGVDAESEPCAVGAVENLIAIARPPTTCGFCQNVSTVQRVGNLTRESFEKLYAYSAVPVVITDGTTNWTAPQYFSYQFFKSLYSKGSPALQNVEENCQFFPYQTNFTTLEDVFDMEETRALMKDGSSPWYIGWSNCDLSAANALRQHYNRPYFLPQDAESSKTDWIFMGSPGYGAEMHIDFVNLPSWQAQIVGTKLWTLEPPPECFFQCPKSVEIIVNPGDIIVLDTNKWYHSTKNVGSDISITIGSEYD